MPSWRSPSTGCSEYGSLESVSGALVNHADRFARYLLRPARKFRHVHGGGEYDYEIDTHFNLDGHEGFVRILCSYRSLPSRASEVQLDTLTRHLYRRFPELELPESTP